jgi:hypothetical protein
MITLKKTLRVAPTGEAMDKAMRTPQQKPQIEVTNTEKQIVRNHRRRRGQATAS